MSLGVYVTCDEAECDDCFAKNGGEEKWLEDGGFEEWREPLTITASEAADTPTHCHECGVLIEHDLTDEGYHYVAEAVLADFTDGRANPVTRMWVQYYGDYLHESHLDDELLDDLGTVLELHSRLPLLKHLAYKDHYLHLEGASA